MKTNLILVYNGSKLQKLLYQFQGIKVNKIPKFSLSLVDAYLQLVILYLIYK